MEVRKIPKKTVTIIPPKDKYYVDKDKYQQKRVAAYCRGSTDSEEQLMSYKTQKKVSDALDGLKCTRIVIAHRLSTIKNCDRILVMDDGRIVEHGNYKELIEKNGMFADLVARQRLEGED